jgi:hypothetical protein
MCICVFLTVLWIVIFCAVLGSAVLDTETVNDEDTQCTFLFYRDYPCVLPIWRTMILLNTYVLLTFLLLRVHGFWKRTLHLQFTHCVRQKYRSYVLLTSSCFQKGVQTTCGPHFQSKTHALILKVLYTYFPSDLILILRQCHDWQEFRVRTIFKHVRRDVREPLVTCK